MNLRRRLRRLVRLKVDAGWQACRERRGQFVFVTARQLPDGTVVAEEDNLLPCARCGQIPEQFIEVVETIVEQPSDPTASAEFA